MSFTLHTIHSNSSGNCYILGNENECIIIELGVRFQKIKEALGFNLSKVVMAICSHEHFDHYLSVNEALNCGIEVVMSQGTKDARDLNHHNVKVLKSLEQYKKGNFKIMPFDVKHDCKEPFGFLISHPECGVVCFMTDSYFCEFKFPKVNNYIIECNYSDELLGANFAMGDIHSYLRDRTITSHMSLENLKDLLTKNDLSATNNIVLIHLSERNGNPKMFRRSIEDLTGKNVHVATPGLTIPFGRRPF